MQWIIPIAIFAFIAISSKQIGKSFKDANLPLITGYLIAGIIAGPYVLGLITKSSLPHLLWVDEVSLAFIAFAAGSELNVSELRGKVKSISWITIGVSLLTFILGTVVFYFVSSLVPLLKDIGNLERIAISMMMAAILIARSPSSAIAIIQELRAKGPFTQVTLGVTIISDVVVIFVFALTASIAGAVFKGIGLNIGFIFLIILELTFNIIMGIIHSQILRGIFSLKIHRLIKTGLTLLSGYGVYVFSTLVRARSHELIGREVLIEPLLVCMVASFVLVNFTKHRLEFLKILHDTGPFIYIAFFTLTGASLALDTLMATWYIALALFLARFLGIVFGAFLGGSVAGDPAKHNRLYWMAFLTQAGVGLGLAKDVAVEFPELGGTFATIAIAVIVINQIVGPPFHKIATRLVNEAHEKASGAEFDGVRDALIFGLEDQSLALARELIEHDWQVKIAYQQNGHAETIQQENIQLVELADFSLPELEKLNIEKVDTIVTMLTDNENHELVENIYENYGTKNVVVRVTNRECIDEFHDLDALTVHPSTAMVNLLEHFVRSPNAVSLLLGSETEQDREVIEIEMSNPNIDGLLVRDLFLPPDILVLQIHRNGETIFSQGYTRIKLGDKVSVLGSQESLKEVIRRFEI